MRWRGRMQSGNVEDRRGIGPGGLAVGGGLGGLVLAVVVMLMGGDPRAILNMQERMSTGSGERGPVGAPATDESHEFVSVVLKDTEDVWNQLLGGRYQEPQLVLFSDQVESACGVAGATVGPFYCPGDAKVYLDTSFFDQLDRMGAAGDFAQAYVIAHEVGHHVQNLMGISDQVRQMRSQLSPEEYNALSVRVELQADFYAGVWAHHAQAAKQVLEPGDIDEALGAASAIGDDRLQRQTRGVVVPESFTHGTSEQRARWFRKGFETGDPNQGDTFRATTL